MYKGSWEHYVVNFMGLECAWGLYQFLIHFFLFLH